MWGEESAGSIKISELDVPYSQVINLITPDVVKYVKRPQIICVLSWLRTRK